MAAAARPYWTGLLKPSLVTIAVRLYPAEAAQESFVRSANPSFHRIGRAVQEGFAAGQERKSAS
jgi:non-homologous end joining protein Ku